MADTPPYLSQNALDKIGRRALERIVPRFWDSLRLPQNLFLLLRKPILKF
jgi:hypothetical protein